MGNYPPLLLNQLSTLATSDELAVLVVIELNGFRYEWRNKLFSRKETIICII